MLCLNNGVGPRWGGGSHRTCGRAIGWFAASAVPPLPAPASHNKSDSLLRTAYLPNYLPNLPSHPHPTTQLTQHGQSPALFTVH